MNRQECDCWCHENKTHPPCKGIEPHHPTTFPPDNTLSLRPETQFPACISRRPDEISPEDFLRYVKAVSPSAYEPLLAVVTDREAWANFRRTVAEDFYTGASSSFLERMPLYPLCFGEPRGMPRQTSVVYSKTHRLISFEDLAEIALTVLKQREIIKRIRWSVYRPIRKNNQ